MKKIFAGIMILSLNFCWLAHADTGDKRVLVLVSQKSAAQPRYQQIISELKKSSLLPKLSVKHVADDLSRRDDVLQQLKWVTPDRVSVVIALGEIPLQIARDAFKELPIPIVFTLVYEIKKVEDNVFGIRLLPPVSTQLNYLKLLLPDATHLGVIYSDKTEDLYKKIKKAIEDFNSQTGSKIIFDAKRVETADQIWPAWYRLSKKIDVLWMIPDLYLYQKFPVLQKDSIKKKIPIFVFTTSEKIAKMGAAFALSPDYTSIGSQLIANVETLIKDSKRKKIMGQIGTYIGTRLMVNKKTLEDLDIDIPQNAQQLISREILERPDVNDIRYDATATEKTIKGLPFTEAVFQIEESFYVVTASRKKERVQHAPSIMTVINRNDLQFQQASSVAQILNSVPGFNTKIDHLGDDIFEIRGTSSFNKFLVMIDSHELNNQIFGGVRYVLDSIPLSLIEKIEIIRGPGSVMYGANAFIGVINIITRNLTNKHTTEVQAGAGSFETYQFDFLHGSQFDNWQGLISGIYRSTDGDSLKVISDAEGLSGFTKDNRENAGMFGKINYKFSDGKNMKISGFFSDSTRGPYIGQAFVLNDDTSRNYRSYYIDVEGNVPIKRHKLMLRGYVDQFFFDADWQLEPPGFPVEDFVRGQLAEDKASDFRAGLETQFDYQANDELSLLFGGEYYYAALYDSHSKDNYTPSQVPNPNFNFIDLFETDDPWIEETDQIGYSGFSQLHYNPFYSTPDSYFDKFSLIAGLRYDYNDRYGAFWSPRAGIVVGPIQDWFIKFLYGRAFRSPNFNEIKAKKQGDVVGNIDLNNEKIDTIEAELSYDKWARMKPRLNFFHNRINDLIIPDPSRLNPPRRFLNLEDEINRYGFESEIKGVLPLNINYYFNASYLDGDRMELIPQWKSNLLFGIPFKERFNFIYYMYYIGERHRASDDSRDDLDPVLLQNISFTANFMNKRLCLRFDVRNIFDEEYESPDSSGRILHDYPMAGRYLFGSIKLQMSSGSK